jgi:predicted metal-dependent hydrolase
VHNPSRAVEDLPAKIANFHGFMADALMLQRICLSVLHKDFAAFRNAEIKASFYPYLGLTHTIRRRGSRWVVRISDHCRNAPAWVLEAIVAILACKITHRKPGKKIRQIYEAFRKDPRIAEEVKRRRLLKGRKIIRLEEGEYHAPEEIYCDVNRRYFNNQVEIRAIGWGPRRSWGRLGHYDPIHQTITLSPVLDSPRVPEYVVGYIIYHEMLHTLFGDSASVGRNMHHPPEYRRAERAHPDYAQAKEFLRKFCRGRSGNREI